MSKKTKFYFPPATEIQSFIFVRFLAEREQTNNMFLKEKVIKTLAKINYCFWLWWYNSYQTSSPKINDQKKKKKNLDKLYEEILFRHWQLECYNS